MSLREGVVSTSQVGQPHLVQMMQMLHSWDAAASSGPPTNPHSNTSHHALQPSQGAQEGGGGGAGEVDVEISCGLKRGRAGPLARRAPDCRLVNKHRGAAHLFT